MEIDDDDGLDDLIADHKKGCIACNPDAVVWAGD
jgi:hypothetical protein